MLYIGYAITVNSSESNTTFYDLFYDYSKRTNYSSHAYLYTGILTQYLNYYENNYLISIT